MLAAFSGGGKIELREIPMHEPGPGEALVRVAAVGVCETDVHTSLHSDSHAENPRIMGFNSREVSIATPIIPL